jgi:iron complex outermembrane receptor protein
MPEGAMMGEPERDELSLRACRRKRRIPRGGVGAFCLLAVALGGLMAAPPAARAAQQPVTAGEEKLLLEEIPSVFGASKYEQHISEAPALVTLVTAEEIRKLGYRTIGEIVNSVTGFYLTSDRNYQYLGVRGFSRPGDYNTRILLLVDGTRQNDNIFDSAPVGTEALVDVDLIDRVEVIRGGASSLYGSNAFFAVINIITKRGRDYQGLEASAEVASYQTYKGRLTYGRRLQSGVEFSLSGTYYRSHGEQRIHFPELDTPATNDGVAEDLDRDWFGSFLGKVSLGDFSLQGGYAYRRKEIPTASYGTIFNFHDPAERTVDEQGYVELKYDRALSQDWRVLGRAAYHFYDYYGLWPYDYPPVTINKDATRGDWWTGELQAVGTLFRRHTVTFGGEIQDNLRQHQENFDVEPAVTYMDQRDRSTDWGVYLQDEFLILENLILNAGVRYDCHESFGGAVSPRIALIYRAFQATWLKLLYGTAFRAPNVYERFYRGGGFKANPDLDPEKITNYGIVLEQYFGPHIRAAGSLFYHDITDLITQVIDPSDGQFTFRNVGHVIVQGVEVELEGRWAAGFVTRLGYSYQHARETGVSGRLSNSPEHIGKLGVVAPLWRDKLFAGADLRALSNRNTVSGGRAGGYLVTNLTLTSFNLVRGLELSAGVYNLFDVPYGDPGGEEHVQNVVPREGRVFRLKITYAF